MEASEAFSYYTKSVMGYNVHYDTVSVTWMILLGAVAASLVLTRKINKVPGRMQSVAEMLVEYFNSLCESMAGKKGRRFAPYIMSIFLFILSCNWLGLFPAFLKVGHIQITMPPTRDISTTASLAIISFFAFQYFGFRDKGIKYLLHYIYPIPLLVKSLPRYLLIMIPPLFLLFVFLNIVEELARVLSLTVRLMGNILGEHVVASSLLGFVVILLGLSAICAPFADVLPIFLLFLGLLTGAIQAFIFSVLTLSYIGHAVEEEH